MSNILLKLLRIPSGEKVNIQAHDTWHVRWWSMGRAGGNGIATQTARVEVFPNESDAHRFAQELKTASALLQDFNGLYDAWGPWVTKNNYKGV